MHDHLFTHQNAREMALRSNAVQAQRRREQQAIAPLLGSASPNVDYAIKRLARVRRQLDRVDRMIQTEKDPQKLDRLASASMRLSDQEFALAGRPKPGSRKPQPEPRHPLQPPGGLIADAC